MLEVTSKYKLEDDSYLLRFSESTKCGSCGKTSPNNYFEFLVPCDMSIKLLQHHLRIAADQIERDFREK